MTTPTLTPAQRGSVTRRRNTAQAAIQAALNTACGAYATVTAALCDEGTLTEVPDLAARALPALDAVLSTATRNARDAQPVPLSDEDRATVKEARNRLNNAALSTPVGVEAWMDGLHPAQDALEGVAATYEREVRLQNVDPYTRYLVANNID